MAIDAYMGSDPGIIFGTYLWATLCAHETMAQFVKYKFDDHPDMSAAITKVAVCNYPSNQTSKMEADLEKLKSLPAQFKFLSDDLAKAKSNQNSTYDMASQPKNRGS